MTEGKEWIKSCSSSAIWSSKDQSGKCKSGGIRTVWNLKDRSGNSYTGVLSAIWNSKDNSGNCNSSGNSANLNSKNHSGNSNSNGGSTIWNSKDHSGIWNSKDHSGIWNSDDGTKIWKSKDHSGIRNSDDGTTIWNSKDHSGIWNSKDSSTKLNLNGNNANWNSNGNSGNWNSNGNSGNWNSKGNSGDWNSNGDSGNWDSKGNSGDCNSKGNSGDCNSNNNYANWPNATCTNRNWNDKKYTHEVDTGCHIWEKGYTPQKKASQVQDTASKVPSQVWNTVSHWSLNRNKGKSNEVERKIVGIRKKQCDQPCRQPSELLSFDDNKLILHLQSENNGLNRLIELSANDSTTMITFIQILSRLASTEQNNAMELLFKLTKSEFPRTLNTFLSSYLFNSQGSFNWSEFFNNIRSVLSKIFEVFPSAASTTFGPVTLMVVQGIRSKKELLTTEQFDRLLTEFERMKQICLNGLKKDENAQNIISRDELLHSLHTTPPEDFRKVPITLEHNDVHGNDDVFLRSNIVSGKYQDVEHYLDVNFRLFREDFVAPLREGIKAFIRRTKAYPNFLRTQLGELNVYYNVHVVNTQVSEVHGVVHELYFDSPYNIDWVKSKKLLYGSLVCLSDDDFKNFVLAIVTERDDYKIYSGLFTARFLDFDFCVTDRVWVMIESPTYYEAYAPVLMGLKQLNSSTLPFQSIIVQADPLVEPPDYLLPYMNYTWRKNTLGVKPNAEAQEVEEFTWKPLEDSSWPSAAELKLDESQHQALKVALTKRVAIIQGPPGTGKTWLGLQVADVLLQNLHGSQILVVCFTNHALDQYLEGIMDFCPNGIIRVGGQSKSERLAYYNLSNLRRLSRDRRRDTADFRKSLNTRTNKIYTEMSNYEETMAYYDSGYLIQETVLSDLGCLSDNFKSQLDESIFYAVCQNSTAIEIWLEVEGHYYASGDDAGGNKNPSHRNNYEEDNNLDEVLAMEEAGKRIIDFGEFMKLQKEKSQLLFGKKTVASSVEYYPGYDGMTPHECWNVVQKELENGDMMSVEDAGKVDKIWALNMKNRWRLYRLWHLQAMEQMESRLMELREECERNGNMWKEFTQEKDYHLLSRAKIIGMTTTGASKNRALLQRLQPEILIVEEAAEVLEVHIVASLTSTCKHLILIGDQQQLRPSPSVYRLAVDFKLDVSLFERLINNGVPYARLNVQHRMRPEIAALLVPHIYKNLQNHSSVELYPNVNGMTTNAYFFDHKRKESKCHDSRSRSNEFEAQMIVRLFLHLLAHGYREDQITILAAYLAQVSLITGLLAKLFLTEVKCTAVDNYQGEENDIILLSLVRSNKEGNAGFLKVENRVCVALSRARMGLYCVGNFDLLASNSSIWKPIVKTMTDANLMGNSFKFVDKSQPDGVIEVFEPSDFDKVVVQKVKAAPVKEIETSRQPEGVIEELGSSDLVKEVEKAKDAPLKEIQSSAHESRPISQFVTNMMISTIESRMIKPRVLEPLIIKPHPELCMKAKCERQHLCFKTGNHECGPCVVETPKLCPYGHENVMPCNQDPETFIHCEAETKRVRQCGHEDYFPCSIKDFDNYGICTVPVERELDCGHKAVVACYEYPDRISVKCMTKCTFKLNCGHDMIGHCFNKNLDAVCHEKCARELKCGHKVIVKCSLDLNSLDVMCPEKTVVKLDCGHYGYTQCDNPIKRTKCMQKVETRLKCGHEIMAVCSSSDLICDKPCPLKLSCGHDCPALCSQPCDDSKCTAKVYAPSDCDHTVYVTCGKKTEDKPVCEELCQKKFKCGHLCTGACFTCCQTRIHSKCHEACSQKLLCGHTCVGKCGEQCLRCKDNCNQWCSHQICLKKCGKMCTPCTESCEWQCEHQKCTNFCHEECDRETCDLPCKKKLPCGHDCLCYCGEPCSVCCPICKPEEFAKISFVFNDTEDNIAVEYSQLKFVLLEDCKHLVERSTMDAWVSMKMDVKIREVGEIECPKCFIPVRANFRYGKVVRRISNDILKIKNHIVQQSVNICEDIKMDMRVMKMTCRSATTKAILHRIRKILNKQELVFLRNKVHFLEATYDLKERMRIISRQSFCGDILDTVTSQATDFEDKLELLKTHSDVSGDIWEDLSWEFLRIVYLCKVMTAVTNINSNATWRSNQMIRINIEFATEALNGKFDQKKKVTVETILEHFHNVVRIPVEDQLKNLVEVDVMKTPGFVQSTWFVCENSHVIHFERKEGAEFPTKCLEPSCSTFDDLLQNFEQIL